MDRAQKNAEITALKEAFSGSELVLVTHYCGLSVPQLESLRGTMREAGGRFKVAKNTLAKLAIKDTDYAGLDPLLTGPTGLAFASDPVAVAKSAIAYAKTNDKFVIIGGSLGPQVIDAKGVEALSKMPSIEELRSKLLGLMNAPASTLVGTFQAAPRDLLGVMQAVPPTFLRVLAAKAQQPA